MRDAVDHAGPASRDARGCDRHVLRWGGLMSRVVHPDAPWGAPGWAICLLVAGFAGGGCGPIRGPDDGDEAERYADAMCGAIDACGCQPRYGDADACRETLGDAFSRSHASGLAIDHDCFDAVLSSAGFGDCSETTHWPLAWNCAVLHGRKGEGASCDATAERAVPPFRADECGLGLRCAQGRCVDLDDPLRLPEPAKALGDPCEASAPAGCFGVGLVCSAQGRCELAPALGEACTTNHGCLSGSVAVHGPNAYCQGLGSADVGVCAVTLAAGSPCDPADNFACDGEPTYFGWCDPSTSTCRTRAPAVCLADENVAGWRIGAADMP